MGYHTKEIPKGTLGDFSKITEEYLELEDGFNQKNIVLQLCEIADLLGALEAYTVSNWGITLAEIYKMTRATKEAFDEGKR
jgi:hypothetical protein